MKSPPLPCQPCTQPDEDQPGEPLLQSREAGIAAKQLPQGSTGISHAEIDGRTAYVEDQTEQQDLPRHAAAARVNELGKKRQEEERDLRIQNIGYHALAKNGGQAVRLELLLNKAAGFDQHLDAKIDQIGHPGI